jgi:DNA-binding transcriptional MerR regulator
LHDTFATVKGTASMVDGMLQIGEVADAVGLSLRTIRHYEEVGLVTPSGRSSGGFRLYTDDDVARLRLIKHMKPLDFSLSQMRQLLEARDSLFNGEADDDSAAEHLDRLALFATTAEQRCDALRHQLEQAEAFAASLRREVRRSRRHLQAVTKPS